MCSNGEVTSLTAFWGQMPQQRVTLDVPMPVTSASSPAGPCLPWDGSSLTPSACSVPSASPGHYRLPFLRYSQLHAASALQPVPLMPFWWPKTLEKSGRLPGCCCTAALPGCQRAAGMGGGRAVPLVLAQVYIFRRRFIFSA